MIEAADFPDWALRSAWRVALEQDFEPEMTAEWFPAWMLLEEPGLAAALAPCRTDGDPSRASMPRCRCWPIRAWMDTELNSAVRSRLSTRVCWADFWRSGRRPPRLCRYRGRKREQRRSLRRRYDHPRPNAIGARGSRRLAHGLPSQLRPDSFKFDPNRIRVDDGCDSTSGENRIVGVRSVSHGERSCGGCVTVAYDVRHRCLLPGFERVPPNPLAQPDSVYRLPPLSIWWRRPLT